MADWGWIKSEPQGAEGKPGMAESEPEGWRKVKNDWIRARMATDKHEHAVREWASEPEWLRTNMKMLYVSGPEWLCTSSRVQAKYTYKYLASPWW